MKSNKDYRNSKSKLYGREGFLARTPYAQSKTKKGSHSLKL